MIPKLIFFGKVTDGVLKLTNRKVFDASLKDYEGKEVEVTVSKKSKRRSNPQNRYLFGVVYPILKEALRDAGFNEIRTSDDVHNAMKGRYLKRKIVSDHGEELEIIVSTASLTTSEFMDYIAELQQFSAEFLNLVIPEPGQTEFNF